MGRAGGAGGGASRPAMGGGTVAPVATGYFILFSRDTGPQEYIRV